LDGHTVVVVVVVAAAGCFDVNVDVVIVFKSVLCASE
jgi:hypothetical protein